MTQASRILASAAVIALTLGITGQTTAPRDAPPLSTSDITIAAAENSGAAVGQPEEKAEDSAKMGTEDGTHEGDNLGATPEDDTAKIDQPARRNPTTGNTGDTNGSQQ
jgi:hypothetical protein